MYKNITLIFSAIFMISCTQTPPDSPNTSKNATLLVDCGEPVGVKSHTYGLDYTGTDDIDQVYDGFLSEEAEEEYYSDYAYIELFLQDGTLYLTHKNALFNCCPEKISFNTIKEDSTICIKETESFAGGACSCYCCYDVEVQIPNIKTEEYKIIIEEVHLNPNDDQIEIDIDFNQIKEKTYPFKRTGLKNYL